MCCTACNCLNSSSLAVFGTTSYYEQQDSTSTVQTAAIFSPLMFPSGGFSSTVRSNESSAARAGETSARSPCRCTVAAPSLWCKAPPTQFQRSRLADFSPQTARITIRNVFFLFFLPNFHTLVRILVFSLPGSGASSCKHNTDILTNLTW